jgi:hypothetical protein
MVADDGPKVLFPDGGCRDRPRAALSSAGTEPAVDRIQVNCANAYAEQLAV